MLPSEDASPSAGGRRARQKRGAVFSPVTWIMVIGAVLILSSFTIDGVLSLSGFVVVQLNHYSIATRSWYKVGVLLFGIGWFPCVAIPGGLMALRHPWAAAGLQTQGPSDVHERLFGLTLVWAGVLIPGWFIASAILPPYYPLGPISVVVTLVAVAPTLALGLVGLRR
jgi:hypothetical protein